MFLPQSAAGQGAESRAGTLSDAGGLPLRPTRLARFQVTEGTWMSLDVSPDGRTIVFELLGHLYTVPITGGHARQLTSGMAFNRQPRYSPDGRHLVFVSDRSGSANVWIADRDGRHARQLSDLHGYPYGAVASPVWSPDGRTVVVSQMLGATRPGLVGEGRLLRWLLAAYHVKMGRMRWISDTTPDRARAVLGPAFGGDGHAVYAAVDAFRRDWYSEAVNWRIARVELATGRIQPEMGSQIGRVGMRPAVSRDGQYLAYATSSGSHTGLRLRDLRSDRERWLVREVLDDPPADGASDSRDLIPGYAFTPDSRSLIAAYGGKIHRIDVATGRASIIPFIADVKRELGPLTVHEFTLSNTAVHTRSVMQPALSPDGQWVAFVALDRIWVMELPHDGRSRGRPRRLTSDSVGEFYPSWSPDARWIAYSTWVDGEGGAVRRARVMLQSDASPFPSERLTLDTALYFHTAVAPQGDCVVAVRAELPPERVLTAQWNAALDPTLVTVPSSGGKTRTVTSLQAEQHGWYHERYPVDQVYFTDDPERIYVGLISFRWDGTDHQRALAVSGREDSWQPLDVAGVLSPDRSRALVTRKYALFELGLPAAAASEPATIDLQRTRPDGAGLVPGAARRWGTVLAPWISWSRDGRRVLFAQGGTLFVGDVRPSGWTAFARVDVPLTVPVDVPRGTLVLRGARLITMRGHEIIEHGELVVRDNSIAAVGAAGNVAIPIGAQVLDLAGTTILPGYVDVHDHMWLPKGVHPQQCWQCLARLAYGITTARDPQPSFAADVFAYQELERTGELLGPRVFSTGIAYTGADRPIESLEDAREAIRPNAEYFGSETFKIHYDGSGGRRARQLLTMALAEQGLNPTVHGQNCELGLTVVLDGFSGLEHAPPIRIYDDVVTLIARSGTTHTQTYGSEIPGAWNYLFRRYGSPWRVNRLSRFAPPSARRFTCDYCTSEPWNGPPELDDVLPLVSGAARIVAKGGRVGMGSHGDIPGLGLHYEMWLHALGGMTNYEILRSATIVGATAIGHAHDFGSLEPGKVADLQVLDRNPLEDIHHTTSIRYVMKNGRLYQADSLTEISPRHVALAATYFWKTAFPPDPTRAPRAQAAQDSVREW